MKGFTGAMESQTKQAALTRTPVLLFSQISSPLTQPHALAFAAGQVPQKHGGLLVADIAVPHEPDGVHGHARTGDRWRSTPPQCGL